MLLIIDIYVFKLLHCIYIYDNIIFIYYYIDNTLLPHLVILPFFFSSLYIAT